MQPLVSIVIASYNHEKFIGDAIESVLAQSYQHFELIIIDDGSTDSTREVLATYEGDERIKVSYQENQGAAFTLNQGLNEAAGQYLAILNSDDLFHPSRLESLVSLMEEGDGEVDSGILFTDLSFIDSNSETVDGCERSRFHAHWLEYYKKFYPRNPFIHGNLLTTTSNLFMGRKTWLNVGEFVDLRYCHDWDWVLRASQVAKPVFVDQKLMSYRIHETNTILEDDVVSHALENSYSFSSLILTNGAESAEDLFANIRELADSKYCYSFQVMLLTYMRCQLGDEQTLELLKNRRIVELVEDLQKNNEHPDASYYSLSHVKESVESLKEFIDKQASSIKENWQKISEISEQLSEAKKTIFSSSQENIQLQNQKNTLHSELERVRRQCERVGSRLASTRHYAQIWEASPLFKAQIFLDRFKVKFRSFSAALSSFSFAGNMNVSSSLESNARYIYCLDQPPVSQGESGDSDFEVSGWLVDTGKLKVVEEVIIRYEEGVYSAESMLVRPEVAVRFGSMMYAYSGFSVQLPAPASDKPCIQVGLRVEGQEIFSEEHTSVPSV